MTYDRRLADQQFKNLVARKSMKARTHGKTKPGQEMTADIKSMIDKYSISNLIPGSKMF